MSQDDAPCRSLPDNSDMKFDILHRESDALLFHPELEHLIEEVETISNQIKINAHVNSSPPRSLDDLQSDTSQKDNQNEKTLQNQFTMLRYICDYEKSDEPEGFFIGEDYKLKKYSKEIFEKLFEIFSIKKEEFIGEWELDEEKNKNNIKIIPSREEKEPIVSAFSKNKRFIFKIIQKPQKNVIEALLLDYLKYIEDHESTFLMRLLGVYKITVPALPLTPFDTESRFDTFYFLFFTNIVWSGPVGAAETLPIHQIYTLKGRQTQVCFFPLIFSLFS